MRSSRGQPESQLCDLLCHLGHGISLPESRFTACKVGRFITADTVFSVVGFDLPVVAVSLYSQHASLLVANATGTSSRPN